MSASIVAQRVTRSVASASFKHFSRQQHLRLSKPKPAFQTAIRTLTASAKFEEKRYTEDHEWIELSDDKKTGTIGVSTYAAKALGDVVFVELPVVDLEVNAGDTIGAVESVKSASDILSPISGVVTEANSVLEESPATINKSPEVDGWIAKIKVSDPAEVESLMDSEAYRTFTEDAKSE